MKKLFLLDAMALIYRAYFAFSKNPRINSKGFNTSAILGFANTLRDVLTNEKPTHIGVAFDTMAPTQRHDEFVDYKANREAMPEELAESLPLIRELLRGFRIPILEVDGYEADDVIGTLAKKAEKEGFRVYMMTPDKDFAQLVSQNIFMYKPGRMGKAAETWGVKEVCERYGFKNPIQMIDLLGMMGDASDNIPGIPGVGEKTAIKLIAEFDTLENLLLNTDKLKGKLKERVEENTEQAIASKQLATIILDTPINFDAEALVREEPDLDALRRLFDELEFRTFAERFFQDIAVSKEMESPADLFTEVEEAEKQRKNINNTEHQYHLIDTEAQLMAFVKKLEQQQEYCFDTETTGIDAHNVELVGMAFSWKSGEAWYIHMPVETEKCRHWLGYLKDVFAEKNRLMIGQNLKYDIEVLRWYDITVQNKLFDTMLAHYLLEPDMRHNMDVLAETYLNYNTVSITELIGKKGKNQLSMRMVDPKRVAEYAGEDADITFQLKGIFEKKLKEAGLTELFEELEVPLVPVLASMEAEGVTLDIDTLRDYSQELQKEIEKTEKSIFEAAGETFNISSPRQLGSILFEKLKVSDKAKKTKTGQYATGEDILARLADSHPIVSRILDYRSLTKLKSTYVDTLPELINPRDGRIHTSYNQAVAATGRLSSNNPNLQNIPIRTEKGREIRKAFIPRSDHHVLLAADYSQIELRLIAHLSGDPGMQEAFRQGMDIHTATASKVFGVNPADVDKEQRRRAKMVNFGIIYGISAFGLSERLRIPRKEAARIIDSYFEQYANVKTYMQQQIEFAREHGYVETMKGRRRYLRDINSNNATVRGFAERNAINAPIQGSSADMIKLAMIHIHKAFEQQKLQSKMILQVHDELVFDAHKQELDIIQPLIEDHMKNALPLDVPVVVDMNTGSNWLEAH